MQTGLKLPPVLTELVGYRGGLPTLSQDKSYYSNNKGTSLEPELF